MKGKAIIACLAAILIVGGVVGGLYHMENYDKLYYTKVDNAQVSTDWTATMKKAKRKI